MRTPTLTGQHDRAVPKRQLSRDGRDRSKLTPKGCQSTLDIGRPPEAALETTSVCGNAQPTCGSVPMRTPTLAVQHDRAVPKRQLSRDGRDRSKLTPKGCQSTIDIGRTPEAALETTSMCGNVQPTGGNVPMRTPALTVQHDGAVPKRQLSRDRSKLTPKGCQSTIDMGRTPE